MDGSEIDGAGCGKSMDEGAEVSDGNAADGSSVAVAGNGDLSETHAYRCITIIDPATNQPCTYALKAQKGEGDEHTGSKSSSNVSNSRRERPQRKSLEDIIGVYKGGPHGRRAGEQGHSEASYLLFLDFIK